MNMLRNLCIIVILSCSSGLYSQNRMIFNFKNTESPNLTKHSVELDESADGAFEIFECVDSDCEVVITPERCVLGHFNSDVYTFKLNQVDSSWTLYRIDIEFIISDTLSSGERILELGFFRDSLQIRKQYIEPHSPQLSSSTPSPPVLLRVAWIEAPDTLLPGLNSLSCSMYNQGGGIFTIAKVVCAANNSKYRYAVRLKSVSLTPINPTAE